MRRIALIAGVWMALAGAALAQQPAALWLAKSSLPANPDSPFVVESRVAEVVVPLAVTDRRGAPVADLSRDDLQILDNGKPATVTQIRREDDLPLRLALVVDWSDSVRKDLGFERKMALDFLRMALRPETDEAMIVGFRYRVEVTQPLTGELQQLEKGLRPVGGVALSSVYDALIAATEALNAGDPQVARRRAIVLLSDGEDNVSAHGWADVVQAAQRANITIYTIAPQRRRANPAGSQTLMKLASVTGGRSFFISSRGEQPAFDSIRQNLRVRYSVYFKPGGAGGDRYRTLEIRPRDGNLQVWARRGYYADWE